MGVDLTDIFLKYRGQWVALKQDEKTVVVASKNAKAAYEGAIKKGEKKPVLFKVPSDATYFVG